MNRIFLILSLMIFPAFYFALQSENASLAIINGLTPDDSFTVERNVKFGGHERDSIDYYTSAQTELASSRPLLVFIHGGGWNRGDKKLYKFFTEGLTSEGFDVALPNYRMHPEVGYPDFLEDNARAIQAIKKKYPSRNLVLIGHSAGAYNALMMGVKPEYLSKNNIESCGTIRGIVSLAAPTGHFPAKTEPTTTIFPNKIQDDEAPINFTNQPLMPIMLVNGDQDTSVRFENSVEMAKKLGNRATLKIYAGADHADPVKQFSKYFGGPIKDDVVQFIKSLPAAQDGGFCRP